MRGDILSLKDLMLRVKAYELELGEKMFKNIIGVIFSNMFSIATGMITAMLLPIVLQVEGYGYFKTFTLYTSYLGLFSMGIIDGIVLEYGDKDYDQLDRCLFRLYFRVYMFVNIGIAIVFLLISLSEMSYDSRFILRALAAYLVFNNVTGYFQQISQVTRRFKEFSIRKILQSVMSTATVVVIFCLSLRGVSISYQQYIVCTLFISLTLTGWYIYTYREIVFGKYQSLGENITLIKRLISKGFPLMFANLCSSLILVLDRQFVNVLFDKSIYATYAFAYNMLSLVTVAVSAVAMVLYPYLKRTKEQELKDNMTNILACVIIFAFAVNISFFPIRWLIIRLLPQYSASIQIFRVIFPGLAVSSIISIVYQNYYKTLGLSVLYFRKTVVILAISAIANGVAYFFYRTPVAISAASIVVTLIWYLYVEKLFWKDYGIELARNLVYMLIMMVGFYTVTTIENTLLGSIVYLVLFIMVTTLCYHNWYKVPMKFMLKIVGQRHGH